MDALLNSDEVNQKKEDLRTSLCYYITAIAILATFIMSCISLGLTNASTIQNKLYTYQFPTFDSSVDYKEGTTVSITREGVAFPGAGTTIYRNITLEKITDEMKNVKIRELDFNLALLVYNGGVAAYKFSWEGYAAETKKEALPKPAAGQIREIDDVIRIGHHRFIIVGSKELLPLEVDVKRNGRDILEVTFYFGTALSLPNNDDQYPHADSLTNTTFALVYENENYLYTRYGTWKGEKNSATLVLNPAEKAINRHEYHGVAGMDESHFIIAVTGREYNVNQSMPIVGATLCTIERNGSITMSEWIYLPWTMSHNFFDMDNMGQNEVIMVFAEGEGNGIRAVVMKYDRSRTGSQIYFGASEEIQTGGAILHEQKMDLRVLNRNQFAVFYEDNAVSSLILVICEISEADDIAVVSPNYIISRPQGWGGFGWYSFDLCEIGRGDFAIVEYKDSREHKTVQIHHGDILARPFGIVAKSKKGILDVQFAGIVNVKGYNDLVPGTAYYTNSKGELVKGSPFGYVQRSFGRWYVQANDGSLLSNNNLVGIAVSKKKVYLKFE